MNLQFTGDRAAETDIRETIFYTLARRRLPILSMVPSRASLEEIFLELTEDLTENTENQDSIATNSCPDQ